MNKFHFATGASDGAIAVSSDPQGIVLGVELRKENIRAQFVFTPERAAELSAAVSEALAEHEAAPETEVIAQGAELVIGFTKTVDLRELRLPMDSFQQARDAAETINEEGIGRAVIQTSEGEATIWCNYVAYAHAIRAKGVYAK